MAFVKTVHHILKNQRGSIAIMLVLTAVALVTPFVVNFSFDTQINKMKVNNIEDRFKAQLTAESGLKFAMARLRLYKEAYNFLQDNKDAKGAVKQELLDTIWNFPFIYPIPEMKSMNAIQKGAIQDFQKQTFLQGGLQLTIKNISNRINLNMLRISLIQEAIKEAQKENKSDDDDDDDDDDSNQKDKEFNAENQLVKMLTEAIETESQNDEIFNSKYSNLEINRLINELKFYISDPNSVEDAAGGDENFQSADLKAKRAPLASFSEVYGLPEWPDEIINLIKREFTVHGALMIDLNKMTDKLLRILIPDITPEDITEFFEYKNDPEDPKYFNSLDDFKKYIVSIASIMDESSFDERFQKYLAQGLQFGPTPTLFKIESVAAVERATYTLNAYVVIPAQPKPRIPKKAPENAENGTVQTPPPPPPPPSDTTGGEADKKKKEEQKTLLLEPRIVEINVS